MSEDACRYAKVILAYGKAIRQTWPLARICTTRIHANMKSPLPPMENRNRILGISTHGDDEFIRSGFIDLKAALNIAEVYGFRQGRILDWGVGCGRMFRHLPANIRNVCVGADVDSVNVEWCRGNLSGQFEVLHPTEGFQQPGKVFDLIYGWSVMTHLSEDNQFLWLQHLNEVCRNIGLMVLSVHGLSLAGDTLWGQMPECLLNWMETGFQDADDENPDISDVVPAGYYRDTAHMPTYIKDTWSRYVEVVDVIPGGFGFLHDAVVCRRKK